MLIAGDALGRRPGGSLRAPLEQYAEDVALANSSVRKLAALEPEIICFGHRGELYDAAKVLRGFADSL
jgi:glyoxylase-like metal-dependent hydrolase (beta-lactamase superfamily II)